VLAEVDLVCVAVAVELSLVLDIKPRVAMLAAIAFFFSLKTWRTSNKRMSKAGMISGRKYDLHK